MRRQRTLRDAISCVGVGFHSGTRVALTFRPAAPGSGIRFRRADRGSRDWIEASLENARAAPGGTSLGGAAAGRVGGTAPVLAALAVAGIDNADIEVTAAEIPVLEGGVKRLTLLLGCAGHVEQEVPTPIMEVLAPIVVEQGGATARLEPCSGFEIGDGTGAARTGEEILADPGPHDGCLHLIEALADLSLLPARLQARFVGIAADAALRLDLLRQLMDRSWAWRLVPAMPGSLSATAEPAPSCAPACAG